MPSSSTTFTFVRIPADRNEPVEELTASKVGGLEHDELIKHVKEYFQHQQSPIADYPSCDIMALSIPLAANGYQAVSLYSNNYGTVILKENTRATALVTACGHTLQRAILGDVFVGRAHDDERKEWERMDFTVSEADAKADWCRRARSSGGGGGQGGNHATTTASTLSNLVHQQLNVAAGQGKAPPKIIGGSGGGGDASTNSTLFGMEGAPPVTEDWGSWTQSQDEVELKISIPAGIKSKECQVVFKRQSIKVAVAKEVKLDGALFGPVVPDDCTYTLENSVDGEDGRELCITLTKAQDGMTWSWVTTS